MWNIRGQAQTKQVEQKPNIIIILVDDMGFSDIGAFGGNLAPTPRLDQFALEGTRFTQYYTASPICSPSRTSLFTGMFPAEWNFTTFLNDRRSSGWAEQANYLNVHAPLDGKSIESGGICYGTFWKVAYGRWARYKNAPGFKKYGLMNLPVRMKVRNRIHY